LASVCVLSLAACKTPADEKFDQPDGAAVLPPGTGNVDPPQGAVQIAVTPATGGSCGAAHGLLLIPDDHAVSENLVCDLDDPTCKPGKVAAVDGEDGATVDCSVTSVGSDYAVLAAITRKGDALSLSGVISASGGTIAITHFVASTQTNLRGDCDLDIRANHGVVAPGKLWGSFSCPFLTDPSAAGGMDCSARGSVVFEKCLGVQRR
jgi:hypothetical protein